MNELETRLLYWLTPRGFFVGVVVGFLACCLLGRQLVKRSSFREFECLHAYISPTSHYYPTALQVRTLARRQLPPDKIAVIIGGNSILRKTGGAEPWTRQLQRELGDDFRILNLAADGGAANQYGELAAEMLLRDHRKIIHVCNTFTGMFTRDPDGAPQFRYAFLDAQARGLLLGFPERDAALAELLPERRTHSNATELQIQARANCWCSFNDLWHVVGYKWGFTVWTHLCREQPWRARQVWPSLPAPRVAPSNDWQIRKESLVWQARPWLPSDDQAIQTQVLQSVPPCLRPDTLVLICRPAPSYLRRLDEELPGAIDRFEANLQRTLCQLRRQDLVAVDLGNALTDEDYWDGVHLTASGGEKLAHALVPVIRSMANRQHYAAHDAP